MALVSTASLVKKAILTSSAVAAFNVITVEHAEAIVEGAEAAGRGVILAISQNAVAFHGHRLAPIARASGALAELSSVEVSLHLDHVTDVSLLHQAGRAGFSSVMFDAGAARYADNVSATREAARWAHEAGLWVEAELGYVGGKPDSPTGAHTAGVRTDPDEAAAYVCECNVDALAVAVGSSHAMTSRIASLDHTLIAAIAAIVDVPLVLHGSSGVADADLRSAAVAGMRKINVGTALNVSYTRAIREHLSNHPDVSDPRKYLAAARTSMSATVEHLIGAICGGRANWPS